MEESVVLSVLMEMHPDRQVSVLYRVRVARSIKICWNRKGGHLSRENGGISL